MFGEQFCFLCLKRMNMEYKSNVKEIGAKITVINLTYLKYRGSMGTASD